MVDTQTENTKAQQRPPVVVVLGHVDHGKTRLLDAIRKTNIIAKESGGITQHIGAYQAVIGGKRITFLDTPGHEAFSAIRSRGAKIADIAVLVVAADESVKPQTKEAIDIIREADIPFIVAINKIDKEGANIQKVKQDLASHDVLVEDWGGKIPVVEISAKANQNIPELLDMILLVAELEDLQAVVDGLAGGVIIEAHLDRKRGNVATVLVQKGTLKTSDWVVAGTIIGKIKCMQDFQGTNILEAIPSQPVLITGWSSAPDIGREFIVVGSKDEARDIAASNRSITPLLLFLKSSPVQEPQEEKKKILNIIFKSDVTSSLEATESALKVIKSDEVGYSVIHYSVGNITESNIKTAICTHSIIFGFRVCMENSAQKLNEKEKIPIYIYDVIYELIEAVRREMGKLLEPEIKRISLGKLQVIALFKKDSRSQILGGKVISGVIQRGTTVDIIRDSSLRGNGKVIQLQHNKEDVTEVHEGLEAGLKVECKDSFIEIFKGDVLEVYREERTDRTL